ncbi:MAG: hypothetical protein WCL06_00620 [Bacteroidota bacterium]
MKFPLRIFLLLLVSLNLMSLKGMAQDKPEDITQKFFQLYEEKSSDAAIDYVFATNKWLYGEKTTQDNIKAQLKKGIAIIGQYYGYELISKKVLSESYVSLHYMLRYDRQPIQFIFIMYKPNQSWQIQNLKFDDRLEDDIEGMK